MIANSGRLCMSVGKAIGRKDEVFCTGQVIGWDDHVQYKPLSEM